MLRILKVLIAEADPLLQKLYSDLIAEEHSYSVVKCVSTGPKLFEAIRFFQADLVLLDLYLRDFSAIEGLDELRKEFRSWQKEKKRLNEISHALRGAILAMNKMSQASPAPLVKN